MFCLFIYLCLNKQNVKKSFLIKFYIPHSENLVEEPGFKNVKNKHLGMPPF